MLRFASLIGVVLLTTVTAFAQSYPEVDALLEAFYAKDVNTIMKHLPVSLQKSLSELDTQQKSQLARELLLAESLQREGTKVTRPGNGPVLALIEERGGTQLEVVLDKRVSDGYESVLRLKFQHVNGSERPAFGLVVWMRFEDAEWRILQLEPGGSRDRIDLEDPKFVADLRPRTNANEASAIAALRTYNTACITYAAAYSDIGYPEALQDLGGSGGDISPKHGGLVSNDMSTPPHERSGYRFTYKKTATGPDGAYTIVARPVAFGSTGTKSFFTDESTIIRYTEEDREARKDDPELK